MQEYGEEVKAHLQKISSDSRIGKFFGLAGTEINWSKIALSVKNFGQLIGLGLNLAVGATGMATAFYSSQDLLLMEDILIFLLFLKHISIWLVTYQV